MARPLRLKFSGALYHITSRGNESKKYFTRDTTRTDYYSLVGHDWTCGGALGSLVGDPIFDFTDPVTKYKMLAYGCPSYSRSLGGHDLNQHLSASSGFNWQTNDVDLHAAPYYYGEFVMWHGAQFRGMLADQRRYWELFLSHIGSTTP